MTELTSARFQAALSDRYAFDRVLGQGGMGTVYLARDVKHGRQVAIKALSPDMVEAIGARSFLREIRVTAQLQHPHILPLIDSGEAAGCPYYVMPYLKGGSLREVLDKQGRLPEREAMAIVAEVAEALQFAHESGVLHCDIKPENILFSAGHAVLADFGIARAMRSDGSEWRASVNSWGGTPAYVSPEQATGEQELDERSDLYSLAVVLYEMIAGETPFDAESEQAMIAGRFTQAVPRLSGAVSNVSPGLSLVVAKAMAFEPAARFRSVERFTVAIDAELANTTTVARPTRRWSQALALFGFRMAHGMRRRLRRSVAASRKKLDEVTAAAPGRMRLRETTLG